MTQIKEIDNEVDNEPLLDHDILDMSRSIFWSNWMEIHEQKKELDAKYYIFGKFGSELKLAVAEKAVAEKLPILMLF